MLLRTVALPSWRSPCPSFSSTDAQFQADVAQGRVHYFIAGDTGGRRNGGSDSSGEIADWVAQHYTATTVAGSTVYDLTTAA